MHSLPASETSSACTLRDLSSAEEDEHEQMVTPAHSGDSPDSPPAEDGTSPRQWPSHFRKLFPDTAFPTAEEPVNVLTVCSGTEAPVKSLEELSEGGRDAVNHIASVEKDKGARDFIQRNFNPRTSSKSPVRCCNEHLGVSVVAHHVTQCIVT